MRPAFCICSSGQGPVCCSLASSPTLCMSAQRMHSPSMAAGRGQAVLGAASQVAWPTAAPQRATGPFAERSVGAQESCKTSAGGNALFAYCSGVQPVWLTANVLAPDRRSGEQRGPCVLVVRDRGGAVFGCFTAEAWRVAPRYYGTGESFVFQLQVLRGGSLCRPVHVLLCANACAATCLQQQAYSLVASIKAGGLT